MSSSVFLGIFTPMIDPKRGVILSMYRKGKSVVRLYPLALSPLDTIGHLLGDANRDLQDSANSDRHPGLQGLQDSAAVLRGGRVQPVTHMLSQGFQGCNGGLALLQGGHSFPLPLQFLGQVSPLDP